jgi:spoIIIJ-associated protein
MAEPRIGRPALEERDPPEAVMREPREETREPERAERPRREGADDARSEEGPGLSAEELVTQSRRVTEDLLKAMGFEARISATVDGSHVDVTVEVAQDEDLLTGRKGEVRQALQHLLNRVLNRGESSRYHLQLEINDFWKRREEELRDLARRLAEEAIATDGEVVTEYLNAQERRIVHVTLREDARVKTYALGTGMIKRVAIAPADYDNGPDPESE